MFKVPPSIEPFERNTSGESPGTPLDVWMVAHGEYDIVSPCYDIERDTEAIGSGKKHGNSIEEEAPTLQSGHDALCKGTLPGDIERERC